MPFWRNWAQYNSEPEEEPEEVKQAWDELLLVQREQQRYSDIKYDLEQDLERTKKKQSRLEDVSFVTARLGLEGIVQRGYP